MIPEQSVNAQIAQMTQEKTAFAGAMIVLALITGSLFAAVILKPIGSLSKVTDSIAGGDLTARVSTDRGDELGRLGESFNSMAARIEAQATDLRKARDHLEVQVQERTAQLAQANESMRMSEARTRAIVDSALDCVITMDHEGRIIEFNPAAEKTFGYSRHEAVGQLLAEMIIPESLRKRHAQGLSHYLATGEGPVLGKHLEMTAVRSDGSEFPVELAITRLGLQEPPIFAGFIRDITERKRAEETAMRVRQAEEEQRVALEANRVKNEFLATMSHELRTPLNAVIGFTGTMLMGLPGPITAEQKKQLETIKSSARHQLSLINDLLDLAKIDAGKVELKLEPIICNRVVDEVAETLRPLAEKKGLGFETDMPHEVTINTDRRALSQILINLINNAIKFTDAGKVRIELRENNGSTEISVRDTGVGIEREHQEKLFGAFTRVEHRNRSHQEGTGLGLHLSQKLAALLSGQITFESVPGKGSIFTLLLHRRKE
jgi:protein-histidine pros-kinase